MYLRGEGNKMSITFVVFAVVPVVIIAIIAMVIAGVRSGSEKGGEDVIKNVYIYLVLFATLMMTIGGSVGVFMAAADIVAPAPYYQTFEEYKRWGGVDKPSPEGEQEQQQLSEEELRKNYDNMVLAEQQRQMIRAKNSLIKSFGWIVIPLPVFLYFQRFLARKKKDE
jgi:hypothetical protein